MGWVECPAEQPDTFTRPAWRIQQGGRLKQRLIKGQGSGCPVGQAISLWFSLLGCVFCQFRQVGNGLLYQISMVLFGNS